MAFMMPIIKNDWELYQTNRSAMVSRRNSVSSSTTAMARSRKISESAKSEILSSSKNGRNNFLNKSTRSVPTNMTQLRQMPRTISRSSQMNMYRSGAVDVAKTRSNSLIRRPTSSMMSQISPQSSVSSSPSQSPSPSPSPPSDNKTTKKLHKKLLNKIKKTLGIKPTEK